MELMTKNFNILWVHGEIQFLMGERGCHEKPILQKPILGGLPKNGALKVCRFKRELTRKMGCF